MRGQASYLKTIERRILYLEQKLTTVQISEPKSHYVRAELAALTWALPILKLKVQADKDLRGL